jgi:S1-C subfamily serine protease
MTGPGAGAPRTGAPTGARPQPVAARAAVAVAVLGAALLAAAVLAIALLPGGSAPGPKAPDIVPLRVSSGGGIATGFAVADGRVVTVAHVVDGPVKVGGRRVRVLRVDRRSDLALLAAPGLQRHAPSISSAANGEHLRVVRVRRGASSSLSVHVRRSIVAHVRAPGATHAVVRPALELSARIAPGDSGAAVVSDEGALAGVVFAASRNRADTAYAVDASAVRQLLQRP